MWKGLGPAQILVSRLRASLSEPPRRQLSRATRGVGVTAVLAGDGDVTTVLVLVLTAAVGLGRD